MITDINVGLTANDGTGDTLRDAFIIVNNNFDQINAILTGTNTLTISQISGLQSELDSINSQLVYIGSLQQDINNINSIIYGINQVLNSQNISIADLYNEITNLQEQIYNKVDEAPIDGVIYGRKNAEWTTIATIQGPTGPQGSIGPVGPVGPTGPTGNIGITKTSQLINDGDNGVSHFISLEDLPSSLTLYPTTATSSIGGYNRLVTSITDPIYNTTAVDITTGAITGTNQFIAGLITEPGLIIGNPGVFNMTTIGNIRKTSGSGQAEFFFRVYKRDAGGTETLILQSSNTPQITSTIYSEFFASGLWNDGIFVSTDRIVLKFYGTKVGFGSNPTYYFQFGGTQPVRSLVPVPLNVIPSDVNEISIVNAIIFG